MTIGTVCVIAGGLATRLGQICVDTPKVLLPVAGKPMLAHQLRLFQALGLRRVVICTGRLGEHVVEWVDANPVPGLEVTCHPDGPEPRGTAGALRWALPLLGEQFFVTYGDTYLPVDFVAATDVAATESTDAVMTVYKNYGAGVVSNVHIVDGELVGYAKSPPPSGAVWVDYGVLRMSAAAVDRSTESDLGELLSRLVDERRVAAAPVSTPFFEIGTPASLRATDRSLRGGAARYLTGFDRGGRHVPFDRSSRATG